MWHLCPLLGEKTVPRICEVKLLQKKYEAFAAVVDVLYEVDGVQQTQVRSMTIRGCRPLPQREE